MKSPLVWIGKAPRASVRSANARVDRFRLVLEGSSGFWSLKVKKVAGFRNYLCYGIAIKKNSRASLTSLTSSQQKRFTGTSFTSLKLPAPQRKACFFCVFSFSHSIYAPFFRPLAAPFWYFLRKTG